MRPFSFCAAADLHLGMRFSGYPSVKKELIEARFQALDSLIRQANESAADFLIIAGDLFDRTNLPDRDIRKTLDALSAFQGHCIALLPGNHDFFSGPGSTLWKNIARAGLDNLLVLGEARPVTLEQYDLPVVLYPAPCTARHSGENGLGWIRGRRAGEADTLFHLGIAHGSIAGISPDLNKEYYPMTLEELGSTGLDFWVVGHTHIPYPENVETGSAVLIPGSPEPDGFDRREEGAAWLIKVDEKRQLQRERLSTGTYRFRRMKKKIDSADDIDRLIEELKKESDQKTLIQLFLSGELEKSDFPRLGELTSHLSDNYFFFDPDTEAVRPKITSEVIDKEFILGSFPHQLLSRLAKQEDAAALQKAYTIILELQK